MITAKRKSVGSPQAFPLLLKLSQFTLTGVGVRLVVHLDVSLGVTAVSLQLKEVAVSTLQDIYFGIRQAGIKLGIRRSVLGSNVPGHSRGTVNRVLAMEDQYRLALHRCLEQVPGQEIFIVVVDGTINMAALVLVLEAAINDYLLIEGCIILPIEKFRERVPRNSRDAVILSIWEEVRQQQIL